MLWESDGNHNTVMLLWNHATVKLNKLAKMSEQLSRVNALPLILIIVKPAF